MEREAGQHEYGARSGYGDDFFSALDACRDLFEKPWDRRRTLTRTRTPSSKPTDSAEYERAQRARYEKRANLGLDAIWRMITGLVCRQPFRVLQAPSVFRASS